MSLRFLRFGAVAAVACTLAVAGGCSKAPEEGAVETTDVANESKGEGHDHGGWWCDEHGVPEAVCSVCSDDAAADFQDKGDWCDEHQRAESQCFVCHPKYEAKFAAQYEAKYGKKPPKPEDGGNHEGHDHDDGDDEDDAVET